MGRPEAISHRGNQTTWQNNLLISTDPCFRKTLTALSRQVCADDCLDVGFMGLALISDF
jgi:hypothetical protein